MEPFGKRLSRLEASLESLIEEKFARVLPQGDPRTGVSRRIFAAMQGNIKSNEKGQSVAPDLYILVLDPETARVIGEEPSFNEQISDIITQAGLETGIQFRVRPKVKISADPAIEPGQFRILAKFSLQSSDETSTLAINSADENPIPEFAFLIIHGDRVIQLTQQVVNIGRRIDNHVVIEDLRVSRMHAQIRAINRRYVIFDLESSGGTFVNSTKISQATLSPGDVISLAGVDLVYGQDATYLSSENEGVTQPLIPFPDSDELEKDSQ
jgi:hypothetical protein